MVQPFMREYFKVALLAFLQLSNGFDYSFVEEKPDGQLYEDRENKLEDAKLSKRIENLVAPTEMFKRNFRSGVDSRMYKTSNYGHCSCELNFQPIDLGRKYYPRYVQTGVCQPNSCEKYHQCVERKYMIKVLRIRDMKDLEEVTSSSLPKPLRDLWVAETVAVGVSCDCVTDI